MDHFQIPTTNIVDSPESETQTPTGSRSNSFQFPITNVRLLGRYQPALRLGPSSPPRPDDSTYKECLKNHVAKLGGFALDGCGGYIAHPSSDPLSFECAACGCHRSFHRSESTPTQESRSLHNYHTHRVPPPPPPGRLPTHGNTLPPNSPSPPAPFSPLFYPPPTYGVGTLNNISEANNRQSDSQAGSSRINKRYRTKFSSEQKAKMQELAEKIGWKMQKSEEELIEAFCREIGVHLNVFKIWMHNNKSALRSRDGTADNGVDWGNEDTVGAQMEGNDDINNPDQNVANMSTSSLSENKTI